MYQVSSHSAASRLLRGPTRGRGETALSESRASRQRWQPQGAVRSSADGTSLKDGSNSACQETRIFVTRLVRVVPCFFMAVAFQVTGSRAAPAVTELVCPRAGRLQVEGTSQMARISIIVKKKCIVWHHHE